MACLGCCRYLHFFSVLRGMLIVVVPCKAYYSSDRDLTETSSKQSDLMGLGNPRHF